MTSTVRYCTLLTNGSEIRKTICNMYSTCSAVIYTLDTLFEPSLKSNSCSAFFTLSSVWVFLPPDLILSPKPLRGDPFLRDKF
jgi:hypothetical protein